MIEILLRHKGKTYIVTIDDEDEDLAQYHWNLKVNTWGTGNYIGRSIPGGTIYLHRVILERILGRPLIKGEETDHKDRDSLNNLRSNLRLATKLQNRSNREGSRNKELPHAVYLNRGKYAAGFLHNGKTVYLGRFNTPEEAFEAVKRKKNELLGEWSPYKDQH